MLALKLKIEGRLDLENTLGILTLAMAERETIVDILTYTPHN